MQGGPRIVSAIGQHSFVVATIATRRAEKSAHNLSMHTSTILVSGWMDGWMDGWLSTHIYMERARKLALSSIE